MQSENLRTIKAAISMNTAVMLTKEQAQELVTEIESLQARISDSKRTKKKVECCPIEITIALERSVRQLLQANKIAIKALEVCENGYFTGGYINEVAGEALKKIEEVCA